MAVKLADVFVNISTKTDDLDRGLAGARKSVNAFGSVMQGIFQGVGQQVFRSVAGGIRSAVGEIGKAVNAASDLNETLSKTGVVFGDATKEVVDWSKTSATAFGLSQQAALEATSTIGNMFVQLGEGRDMAAGVSMLFVEMAADLASFHNVAGGAEEVLVALQSAFRGEYDALQRYIPTISAATVEQQAFIETGKDNAKQLTALEKAYAVQSIVLREGATAWGDFGRTIGGLANQQRIFAANMRDTAATIGQAFAPIATTILRQLNKLITQIRPYGEGIINSLADGLARGIIAITPVLVRLRQLFTYWLKPGSPPRLLPELDKWGREAMNVYLQGWTTADLGIFDELANSLETVIRSFAGAGSIKETDLVTRVFGTRDAIARAIAEFQRAGSVSQSTLRAIARAAGPAGDSITALVSSYFDLQTASRAAAKAQEELTAVTERYDAALEPINDKLRAVQAQQADLRDQQRAAQLNAEIADINTSASDRQLAQLELQEIELRRQQRLLEDERDTAVGAAEDKLEAARKEEAAKQDAYNRQAAIMDQQVQANRLIEEEASLRERLANEALAEQERRMRELEAAQKEMERAEEDRRAQLERVYQAQLAYNMQIADTPGKIALLRLELGRYKEGSAEYYDILTQIAGLEQQLAREREAGAGGAGSMFGPLEEATGEGGVLGTTLEGVTALTEALDAMFEALEAPQEAPTGYWLDIANAVVDLTTAIKGFVEFFGGSLDQTVTDSEEAGNKLTELQKNRQAQWLAYLRLFTALFNRDWEGMWKANREIAELGGEENRLAMDKGFERTNTTMGERLAEATTAFSQWLADRTQAIVDWGTELKTAAGGAIANFWSGITEWWDTTVVPGWRAKIQWLRDLLPGSEPKNASSPLRRLDQAGAAIVENMMAGMEQARLTVTPQVATALAAPAAGAVQNFYFDQVFSTQPDWGTTRAASRDGVLAALRAGGR